jgi:hypothetical protein
VLENVTRVLENVTRVLENVMPAKGCVGCGMKWCRVYSKGVQARVWHERVPGVQQGCAGKGVQARVWHERVPGVQQGYAGKGVA